MLRLATVVLPFFVLVSACSSDDGSPGAAGSGGAGTGTGGTTSATGGAGAGGRASGGASTFGGGAAATGGAPSAPGGAPFGEVHEGSYHLGPVDFAETEWHNSCAPYPSSIQTLTGNFLAGVDNAWNGDGSLCDSCALVKTNLGEELVVRIVTTGVSNTIGDMDVSPEAYDVLHVKDDPQGTPQNPRPMSWQLVRCPDTGNLFLQFQTGANVWWTSFWVRNGALPVEKVEVKSANHAAFSELRRETDGTFNDDGGFGEGAFELRITPQNGSPVTVSLPSFDPGAVVDTGVQFP